MRIARGIRSQRNSSSTKKAIKIENRKAADLDEVSERVRASDKIVGKMEEARLAKRGKSKQLVGQRTRSRFKSERNPSIGLTKSATSRLDEGVLERNRISIPVECGPRGAVGEKDSRLDELGDDV